MKLETLKVTHQPFWLLTISIFIALILPALVQDGMFMDGILYTCVSKNLAEGLGSFWFPRFAEVAHTYYWGHPPLVFGIQSLFFKFLGSSIYVERFYSFLTACITAWLITLVWKEIFQAEYELKKLSWLPVLWWIISPVSFWAYTNNVLENTMGIFTLAAVLFILKGLNANPKAIFPLNKGDQGVVMFFILSGIFIFFASLSKGIQGMFPMAAIGFYWITHRKISFLKMTAYSLILIGVPAIIYSLLLLNEEIFRSLSTYLIQRVFNSILNVVEHDNRFFILKELFMDLLPLIILSGIFLVFINPAHKYMCGIDFTKIKANSNNIILFFLIAVSGSFPLMVTLEQSGIYLITSLPFYAIGFSMLIAPGLAELLKSINVEKSAFKTFRTISIILLIAVIAFSALQIGKTKRDHDMLHDVYIMGEVIQKGSTISIPGKMWNQWSLHCYLIRHFNISLYASN
ncbi:MAG: glycosyltransferase family 39 protein, partial [Bacteroidetes bacterium]|nr:glycosyltransferase family 39 protein [Bacteroidota bacterium]